MIKIENTEVRGFEAAIREMRNQMNSWEKSDSYFDGKYCKKCTHMDANCDPKNPCFKNGVLGGNDIELMKKLVEAGTDHRKFMRFITVTCDIIAPLYWWEEYDTYKVGTVVNSCSTMHTICDKEFTLDDFSHEHLTLLHTEDFPLGKGESIDVLKNTIKYLNEYRDQYNNEVDTAWKKRFWWQIIQLLPSSYNQRRTVLLNYDVLLNMYHARKNHKLDEWLDFCEWVESLPYMEVFLNV